MTQTALEKAQRKLEQAKAALDALKARETAEERKKDTRRKIVLGGALLELAKTDKDASALVSHLVAGLTRDHDKKLFDKSVAKEAAAKPAAKPVEPAKVEASVSVHIDKPASEEPARKEPLSRPGSGYSSFPIRPDTERL